MRWNADPARSLTMTTKVEADTRAWRSEADRIMGFWDERLIADLYACILTTEMLEAFNHWLQINNHKPWPKETFGPPLRAARRDQTARGHSGSASTAQGTVPVRTVGLGRLTPSSAAEGLSRRAVRDVSDFH